MNTRKLITSFFALLLAVSLLVGCSSNVSDTEVRTLTENFLNAYKNKQSDAVSYLDNSLDNPSMEFNGFQALLAEKIEFSVKGVDRKDGEIIVSVEIINVDLKQEFIETTDALGEYATQEEILSALKSRLESPDCATRRFDCEIAISDTDNPKIIMTESLSNALLGGYNEYLSELTES